MALRPVYDRVIVRVDEPETQSKGGVLFPLSGQKAQRKGEVLAVGPGTHNYKGEFIATQLKPGDRIVFGAYAGTEIKHEGEKYRVMREGDIAGVIEGDHEAITTGQLEARREGAAIEYQ